MAARPLLDVFRTPKVVWPDGRRFAFTIIDDTDHATVERVAPMYALLRRLGLRTTKTVWVFRAPDGSPWADNHALEDPDYLAFVRGLRDDGFEIALHGVRGESSERDLIARGLERYRELLGERPRLHVNHSRNLDNVHWGGSRLPRWRRALRLHRAAAAPTFGHVEGSPHFWGDLVRAHVTYVRGRCFPGLNTLKYDPYMPAHEPRFPYVPLWFSCSNGETPERFMRLLGQENQDRLEEEGGLAIVYTHFGLPGFRRGAEVAPEFVEALTRLGRRDGWFRPVGAILDHLVGARPRRIGPAAALRLEAALRLASWGIT